MGQIDTVAVILAFFSGLGVWLLQLVVSNWRQHRLKYDVFLSYPMKGLVDTQERDKLTDTIRRIKQQLEQDYEGIRIFASVDDKTEEGKRLLNETQSFNALRASRCFVLIYPEKASSSVLLEAGCALALNKISIFISKNNRDLPYLIHARAPFSKNILLFEYNNLDDLPDFTSKILSNISFFRKRRDGPYELKSPL